MASILLDFLHRAKEGADTMKTLHSVTRVATLAPMLTGTVSNGVIYAQSPGDSNRRNSTRTETTISGCLNKSSGGNYTLTDEKTGVKTAITGPADLEKHSNNHRVALTGMTKTDANGNRVFEVTRIQHISASCKAGTE